MSQGARTIADHCLQDARLRLPHFIDAVIERGVERLAFRSALATDLERSLACRDAAAALLDSRRAIARAYLLAMDGALLRAGEASPGRDGPDICLDDHLPEQLDLAHLRDAAEHECWAERVEFESLFCGAGGELVVQGENPLRPELHANSLAAAIRELPARRVVRQAWFMHLGEALGMELATLYASLSRRLRMAGVREAEFIPPMAGGRAFVPWTARG